MPQSKLEEPDPGSSGGRRSSAARSQEVALLHAKESARTDSLADLAHSIFGPSTMNKIRACREGIGGL